MSVNADSVFLGCKYALPLMHENQSGSIINLSSIAGLIASHNFAAYNASKAAAWLLSKSVALHCAHKGWDIRCNPLTRPLSGPRFSIRCSGSVTRRLCLQSWRARCRSDGLAKRTT